MQHSEQIAELAAALSKAQGAMAAAKKGSENPHFRSKYADLAAIVEASRKPLADNGLAVLMAVDTEQQQHVLTAKLVHASGQWVESRFPIRPIKSDMQAYGSALTYARRYVYASLVGVVAEDDDDDGNASVTDSHRTKQQNEQVREGRVRSIKAAVDAAQNETELVEMAWPMVSRVELNALEHDHVVSYFRERRQALRAGGSKQLGVEGLARRRQRPDNAPQAGEVGA